MEANPSTSPNEIETRNISHDSTNTGIATKFWLELVPFPKGSVRSLWLFVDNGWRRLDNPQESVQQSVQDAFCNADLFVVDVCYDAQEITGLVVKSK